MHTRFLSQLVCARRTKAKVVLGWNSWFNIAARCTGARRLRVFVGRVAREPPATVWLGRARVRERRNARWGRKVHEKRTDQCQEGRLVPLVSSVRHEKSGGTCLNNELPT